MQYFILSILCVFLALPSLAQDAPKNGYDTLVAAGKLILPDEDGAPAATDPHLAPGEILRRERLSLARNAPALRLLREALALPVSAPAVEKPEDFIWRQSANFRNLARQLRQESDVRLADGDIAGALDSRLTGFDLGAAITRGAPLVGVLTGNAIEALQRQEFESLAAKLSAPQMRAALARLKLIEARRASYLDTWQVEEATAQNRMRGILDPQARKQLETLLATPGALAKAEISEAHAREALALTPEKLKTQISALFAAIIARDRLPFSQVNKTPLPPTPSSLLATFIGERTNLNFRFAFEHNRTAQRLFEAALELRAIKLETGAYPATFQAPIDPFSDAKPLIYKRDGDRYLLYSVGPDGRDDGGLEIQTLVTAEETGQKTVSNRVTSTATGDILAPVF